MLATGWLAYLGFGLTSNSMAPLVSQITAELGISNSAMGFILGTWQLVYIGSAFLCGAFIDRYGVRRGILVAGALIILSGVLRAEATGFSTLLLAVGIFGLGGPLIGSGLRSADAPWASSSPAWPRAASSRSR
jgi:CP family cyanate transporter-like MFS transporter